MVKKFEKWIKDKVDTEKMSSMTKAAKKKFWNEFMNEVLDEEFEYTSSPKKLQQQSTSVNQSSYKIGPSAETLKLCSYLSATMIVVLVSTLQYTLSKYEAALNKLTVLEEANNDPNTRVVTSQQAIDLVKSLQGGNDSNEVVTVKAKKEVAAPHNLSTSAGIMQMMNAVKAKKVSEDYGCEMQNLSATQYVAK